MQARTPPECVRFHFCHTCRNNDLLQGRIVLKRSISYESKALRQPQFMKAAVREGKRFHSFDIISENKAVDKRIITNDILKGPIVYAAAALAAVCDPASAHKYQ